jgi:hypothetical protein
LDLTTAKQRSGWRKLFHDNGSISASMSPLGKLNDPCRCSKKVVDDVDAAISLIGTIMKRPMTMYLFAIDGEAEEEKILPYMKHGMEKT